MQRLLVAVILAGILLPGLARGDELTGFRTHRTTDRIGRTVSWFFADVTDDQARPVVMWVQPGGCESLSSPIATRLGRLASEARGRLLLVEKPGSGAGCSGTFRQEDTLPRWQEALRAALDAAWRQPGVDPRVTLVIGQGEGAMAASRLAASVPGITHVAGIAGEGVVPLYGLMVDARRRAVQGPSREELRMMVSHIQRYPDSATEVFRGHSLRYWSSFFADSMLEALLSANVHVFLVHGTADQVTPIEGVDVLHAYLLARGKDVHMVRIEGADHQLRLPRGASAQQALERSVADVLRWGIE